MSKLKPIGARVVAVQKEAETQTKSGLFIPSAATDKQSVATVESVGPDVKHVKAGQEIIYKEYSTTEVTIDKVVYQIINEEDVLATFEG